MTQESSIERRRHPAHPLAGADAPLDDRAGTRSVDGSPVLPRCRRRPSPTCRAAALAYSRASRSRRAAACSSSWTLPDGRSFEAIARVAWARARRRASDDVRGSTASASSSSAARPITSRASRASCTRAPPRRSARETSHRSRVLDRRAGDGYASAPMRPPGSYKIASRDARLRRAARPERRSAKRARRILDSLRNEILEGGDGSPHPPDLHAPRVRCSGSRSSCPSSATSARRCSTATRSTSCSPPTTCARSFASDCVSCERVDACARIARSRRAMRGARGRTRTCTANGQAILSRPRLPVSPPGRSKRSYTRG